MTEMCQRCYGEGFIVVCQDDLCANSERCIHGDGDQVCPECHGEGVVFGLADDYEEGETRVGNDT